VGEGAQLRDAFEQVNGLLLPGGHCGAHGTPYGDASWQLMQWAKEANDQGDAFPIWGTCQGHEQLAQFGSGAMAPSVLQHTAGTEGWITPVNLTAAGRESSRLLGGAPADVVAALSEQASTIHLHQLSAMASTIEREGSATHAFFKVVATNRDPVHGAEFTSILEARDYPFYSSQFHPEKNAGEWSQGWEDNDTGGEAHSAAAVHAMAYLAEFFVGEARKSPHRWSGDRPGISTPPGTPSAQLPLIYDFTPLRTVGAAWTNQYELTYVWRP